MTKTHPDKNEEGLAAWLLLDHPFEEQNSTLIHWELLVNLLYTVEEPRFVFFELS